MGGAHKSSELNWMLLVHNYICHLLSLCSLMHLTPNGVSPPHRVRLEAHANEEGIASSPPLVRASERAKAVPCDLLAHYSYEGSVCIIRRGGEGGGRRGEERGKVLGLWG